MRWFFLNAVEIGLIGLASILYLLASESQSFHTVVRLASVALAVWLFFSVLSDTRVIHNTLKLLVEQQEVKRRYLQNIVTSIVLRCTAIAIFVAAINAAL
jgi:undecaprenyl pyrophosphate phosphatase UppP